VCSDEDRDEGMGTPENHLKILITSIPLNFALVMNPARVRAIRLIETNCALVSSRNGG